MFYVYVMVLNGLLIEIVVFNELTRCAYLAEFNI